MTAKIDAIADAVVTELNALALGFTATAADLPDCRLEDLATLNVLVVPRTRDAVIETRGSDAVEYSIDVGIRKKLTTVSRAETGPLKEIAETIAARMLRKKLAVVNRSVIKTKQVGPLSKMLREQSVFHMVVTLTVKAIEDAG